VSEQSVAPTTASQSSVGGIEAGGGTLPRTGADTTNWLLVGLTALAFGVSLLAVSSKRFARK
jgi:LPXTG-motif cell wall-anchored protein